MESLHDGELRSDSDKTLIGISWAPNTALREEKGDHVILWAMGSGLWAVSHSYFYPWTFYCASAIYQVNDAFNILQYLLSTYVEPEVNDIK